MFRWLKIKLIAYFSGRVDGRFLFFMMSSSFVVPHKDWFNWHIVPFYPACLIIPARPAEPAF
ncbi:MAG: hypothetical protein C0168_03150 [Candidatus Aminicenantes bacterium]|nr:MAG: hypothetical protein C0168_03150 [Candidatus Aminicenantes bacterium]